MIDDQTIAGAVQFLADGGEQDAANILRTCSIESWDIVDFWMDGNQQLDGLSIEVRCPRAAYEVLTDSQHPITKRINDALRAVLPSSCYLKSLKVRFERVATLETTGQNGQSVPTTEVKDLIKKIEAQKSLMIAVSTGGPRIQEVNQQYAQSRIDIKSKLMELGIDDPNPYPDLWAWYGKWSDGGLPSYQSRRNYITNLYQPLLDALWQRTRRTSVAQPQEPTGWVRVDRNLDKINNALETAKNEEDFQAIGLLCREAVISLAQAVYNPDIHETIDGVSPSDTDAKKMLESYLSEELSGKSNEIQRKFARTTFQLSVELQHRRTAEFRQAALCAEATRAIINAIAIISGQRDPEK